MKIDIDIITCPQWGARAPKQRAVLCPMSKRTIFHHTAGHHAEISNPRNESREEAMRYARDVQAFHMDGRGWNDSGHNFLICRNGLILQGRWTTVTAIQTRKMVVSAHCPGFNDQIGIEHEHEGDEKMTTAQFNSSALLQAWIVWKYGKDKVLPSDPHSLHFATSCPANLINQIEPIRRLAQKILDGDV